MNMTPGGWTRINPGGSLRVIVTLRIPGEQWIKALADAGCCVDIYDAPEPLPADRLREAFNPHCDAVIVQLSNRWDDEFFDAFTRSGGKAFSNYAVGFNNVDIAAASRHRIPIGTTPGVLTQATAEIAVALTFAAARRIVEGDRFVRDGKFDGWRPDLLLGELLWRKKLGLVGAGRIGTSYARMMIEGHRMNVVYFSNHQNAAFEISLNRFSEYLESQGEDPIHWNRAATIEELLTEADCVSLHVPLTPATRHLLDARRLAMMKNNAILVNTSRGQVIDEQALVEHCRLHPAFRAGLDVYEEEPRLAPGLDTLPNVVIVPHLGSGTRVTRENMGIIAARNIIGILNKYPVWPHSDVTPFLGLSPPKAVPHIVNAHDLGLPVYKE